MSSSRSHIRESWSHGKWKSPITLVAGVGIVASLLSLNFPEKYSNALYQGAMVATLIAVVWYTVETRRLRLEQAFDSEIRHHPWLKGSDLKITHDKEEGGLLGRDIVYLPITNVGTTPVHDLRLTVRWQVKGEQPLEDSKQFPAIGLAPGDTYHAKLCEVHFEGPTDHATIDVEICYKSFTGGGGQIALGFSSQVGGGWVNRQISPYQFWLSDGRKFPVQTAPWKGS